MARIPNPLFANVLDKAGRVSEDFGYRLTREVFLTLQENFQSLLPKRGATNPTKNWAWLEPRITPPATGEVGLERKLVGARGNRRDWCNQVPVASGFTVERLTRCAIDMVYRRSAQAYDFVELKLDSNSPSYAAVEVLQYGSLWLLSRDAAARGLLVYPSASLLGARNIRLSVLAPASFYGKERFRAFQTGVNRALSELAGPFRADMSFRFERFRDSFQNDAASSDPAVLRRLLDSRIWHH